MVKVISVSDEAYRKLKGLKRGRSFSEVILMLAKERRKKREGLLEFAGAFADNAKHWDNMKKLIRKDRKKAKLREANF